MRRLGPALLLVVFGGLPKAPQRAPPVAWIHGLAAGRLAAATQGKPVLVFFHADWDVASKELETHTFADPEVRRQMTGFVAVEVDDTDEDVPEVEQAARELGLVGTPALLVLAPDLRTELVRWNEYVVPETLAPMLRRCREASASFVL